MSLTRDHTGLRYGCLPTSWGVAYFSTVPLITDQYSSSVKTWISNIDFLKINVISPLRRLAQHNLISLIKFCATLTCVLNVGTHSRWGLFFDHLASFNYFFSLRISTVVCSLHTHSNTDAFVKNSLYLFLPTLSYC